MILKAANHLFRRVKVCAHPAAIVDEDIGLQGTNLLEQTLRIPDRGAGVDLYVTEALHLFGVDEVLLQTVKPEDGQFAVVAAKLGHLGMKIIYILLVVLVAIIRVTPVRL